MQRRAVCGLLLLTVFRVVAVTDVPGGGAPNPGSLIDLWECNGHTNQLFYFDDGAYKIQYAGNPSLCLDAGDMKEGTQLILWGCNGLPQQKWGYDYKEGTIYLADSVSEATLCADVFSPIKAGNKIQVWACNDYPQQQFDVNWGTTIRVVWSYKFCLDLTGGDTTPGTLIQLWECNGAPNQQWIFDPSSGALISALDFNMCVDAHDLTAGNRLILWGCNGQSQQKWGFDNSMQTLYLQDSMSDATRCMDLYGGEAKKGTAVQIYDCNGCWNQQWLVAGGIRGNFADGLERIGANGTSSIGASAIAERKSANSSQPRALILPRTCPAKPLPPGPKPAGGRCLGNWPEFQSSAELSANPWGAYFTAIYGTVPSGPYPLCIGSFWMFYQGTLTAAKVRVTTPEPL